MNYRRLLLVAAVVGMVALAGCSADGGDGTTTVPDTDEMPTDDPTTTDSEGDTSSGNGSGDGGSDTASDAEPDDSNGSDGTGESDSGEDESESDAGEDESESDDGDDESESDAGEDESESDDGEDENESDDGEDENESDDGDEADDADDSIGLTPVNVSAETVSDIAIAESRNVSEYRAVRNLTTVVLSNNVEQTTESDQVFRVNRTAEQFHQSASFSFQGISQDTDAYLVNQTLYNRGEGNTQTFDSEWTKIDLGENATDSFDRQDILSSSRKYLGNASLSVAGAATVDGTDVYVVEADFHIENFTAVQGLSSPPDFNGTTVHDAAGTYYLDQDTNRIQRVSVTANWTSEFGDNTINQSVESVAAFDYQPVSITLPDAADSAVALGDDGNETDTGDDGNETDTGDDGEQSSGDETDSSDADDSETNQTSTEDSNPLAPDIEVRNGDLAVQPDWTYGRIERVLDRDVPEPDSVRILEERNRTGNVSSLDSLFDWRTFDQTVGMDRASVGASNVSMGEYEVPLKWAAEVRVGGFGNIYLRSTDEMPKWLVRLLTTHEFVHYVQLQNQWIASANAGTDFSTDGSFAANAMVEGGATYVTDEIIDTYGFDGPRNIKLYEGIDDLVSPGTTTAYGNKQYSEGARYIADRIDDPANIERIYDNPPTTSEQVLHGIAPGAEPPVPMNLSVETGETYVLGATDRKGEAYTRHVLANGVDFANASAAAAGWGNDTVVTLQPKNDTGNASYVWIHRWDDSENATEFVDATREYLLQYGTYEVGTTLNGLPARVRTPGERTTALVIGPQSFLDGVTISADGETVSVDAP